MALALVTMILTCLHEGPPDCKMTIAAVVSLVCVRWRTMVGVILLTVMLCLAAEVLVADA